MRCRLLHALHLKKGKKINTEFLFEIVAVFRVSTKLVSEGILCILLDVKPKSAKEARIEAIPLDASEPAHLTLMTLTPDVWNHHEASEEWSENQISPISRAEEATEGTLSQGMCWKGVPYPPLSQVW